MICDPVGCVSYEHFHASLSSFVLNLCHVQDVFHAGYYEYRPNLLCFICTDVYKGNFFFASLSTGTIMEELLHRKSAPTRNLEFIFLLHSVLFCKRALRCQPTASKQAVHTWKYFLTQDGVLLVLDISLCIFSSISFRGCELFT